MNEYLESIYDEYRPRSMESEVIATDIEVIAADIEVIAADTEVIATDTDQKGNKGNLLM